MEYKPVLLEPDDGTNCRRVKEGLCKAVTYSVQLIVKGRSGADGVARETCVSKIVVVNQPQ
ncbi:MAG: hypothetical protein R2744_07630 [Bacteroidales bacterium]